MPCRAILLRDVFLRVAAAIVTVAVAAAAQQPNPIPLSGCSPGVNYETSGFRIRSVRVEQPFHFLRRLAPFLKTADSFGQPLQGSPFRYSLVESVRDELGRLDWLVDDSEHRVRVDIITTAVENCEAGELDLVYSIYSTQVASLPALTWEGRQKERQAPQQVAGWSGGPGNLQLVPSLRYDATSRFEPGAKLVYRPFSGKVDALHFAAEGSVNSHQIDTGISGVRESDSALAARTMWSAGFNDSSSPLLDGRLHESRGALYLAAATPPLSAQLSARVGASAEFGRSTSAGALESGARTTYGSGRLFAGLAQRSRRNTLSLSGAVESGFPAGGETSWRKVLIDVAEERSFGIGDHRFLDAEFRLSAGKVFASGATPVGVSFFGGNQERFLSSEAEWQIRSNPFIRAIPANRFTLDGANGFIAHNLTLSYPIWRQPMVPSELTSDPEFKSVLAGQLVSATSLLQTDYLSRDGHFQTAVRKIPDLRNILFQTNTAVTNRLAQIQPEGDDLRIDAFRACTSALALAERRARSAQLAKGGEQYGNFLVLVSPTLDPDAEGRIDDVVRECGSADPDIADAEVMRRLEELKRAIGVMEAEFSKIDRSRASSLAAGEMKPASEILNTLLHDVNLFSVGPLAMLDAARLSRGPESRVAYGLGGGVRLILVSHASFDLGYVANLRPNDGGSRGAFQFSIRFRDIFD